MAVPSSLTLNYDAILSTTLFNWSKTLEDQISTANAFLFMLKKRAGGYVTVSDIGDRMQQPLMYELGSADSYSGYDQLDVTPMDGITSAFFDWRQAAVPIAISGLEEKKNAGEERMIALLDAKTKQAMAGIKTFFNQKFLQGAAGSSITTAYTSSINGSSFIDPLPLLVKYDPTSSTVIGNINQLTYTWWQNKTKNSTSTTYAGFLKELDSARNDASKGVGGPPDFHVTDQSSYELYCAALRAQHRNPSYQVADIPFDNVAFYGKPVVWDEYVPDVQGGSATQSATSGTWWNLNLQYFQIKVHSGTNFSTTPFVKPENQDAKVAHILWLGGVGVSNRRKQGVIGGIDTTIAA